MERLHLSIDGMSCGHCVAHVRDALAALTGVQIEMVEVGSADIEFDSAVVSLDRITAALNDAGYPARKAGNAA